MTDLHLSIVVQGPLVTDPAAHMTIDNLRRAREAYPQAEIIFSTWAECSPALAYVDRVVVNPDPGSLPTVKGSNNFLCNINRQIVSTLGGLKAATRTLAVKMRSDSYLLRRDLAGIWERQSAPNHHTRFFQARVLLTRSCCVFPALWPATNFISDVFQVGMRQDLMALWSIPHCPPEPSDFLAKHQVAPWRCTTLPNHFEYFAPEQYLWVAFLRLHGLSPRLGPTLRYEGYKDFADSERRLHGHFSFCPSQEAGVVFGAKLAHVEARKWRMVRRDWSLLRLISSSRWHLEVYLAIMFPGYLLGFPYAALRYHFDPMFFSMRRKLVKHS